MRVEQITLSELIDVFPEPATIPKGLWGEEKIHHRRFRDDAVMAAISRNRPGKQLEIGTWRGRGTTILAENNPDGDVLTVNPLPHQVEGKIITGILSKEDIGSVFRERKIANVSQVYANSKRWIPNGNVFDLSMAYIDGCHDADYVHHDSNLCFELLSKYGVIVWHDFHPVYGPNEYWIECVLKGVERFCYQNQVDKVFHVSGTWTAFFVKR